MDDFGDSVGVVVDPSFQQTCCREAGLRVVVVVVVGARPMLLVRGFTAWVDPAAAVCAAAGLWWAACTLLKGTMAWARSGCVQGCRPELGAGGGVLAGVRVRGRGVGTGARVRAAAAAARAEAAAAALAAARRAAVGVMLGLAAVVLALVAALVAGGAEAGALVNLSTPDGILLVGGGSGVVGMRDLGCAFAAAALVAGPLPAAAGAGPRPAPLRADVARLGGSGRGFAACADARDGAL